jgi:hypothetical protein
MTSQNQTEQDTKTPTTPKDDPVQKPAEPPENQRELTDEEIAAVAGGLSLNFTKITT